MKRFHFIPVWWHIYSPYTICWKYATKCCINVWKNNSVIKTKQGLIKSWHLAIKLSGKGRKSMLCFCVHMDDKMHHLFYRWKYFLHWQEENVVLCSFALSDDLIFPNVTSFQTCSLQDLSRYERAPVVKGRENFLFSLVFKISKLSLKWLSYIPQIETFESEA